MDITRMTADQVRAEAARREDRRRRGLPLEETPEEKAERVAEDDARLEKAIQKDVIDYYRAHGCIVYSLSQPRATKQTPGIGDLYVFDLSTGRAWWHETKTPTGKQRPDQAHFEEYCKRCLVGYVLGGVVAAAVQLDSVRGPNYEDADG